MRIRKLELGLLLAIFLVIGFMIQTANYSSVETTVQTSPNLERDAITAGIYITDNSGFLSSGFTGGGTEGDPYVLDGATITVPIGTVGIFIEDTTAHFIIQNCVVNLTSTSSTYGIYLYTVVNATIANCEILGTDTAIYVRSSTEVNLTGNTIYDCANTGVQLYLSSSVDIISNTITDCVWRGILTQVCSNVTLSDNMVNRINYDSVQSNSWGIFTELTDNLTISNNEVRSAMRGTGVYVEEGDNVIIDNNLIWQASTCLFVYGTPSVVISNNNISCGYNYNLWIHTVVDAHVFGNSIHHTTNANGRAIHLQSCSDGLYENNDLFECWYGFSIDSGSGNNTILDNNIGWCDLYMGYDTRISAPQNNWTSNQFSDWTSNPYSISGTAGVSDASASLLTDPIGPTLDLLPDFTINDIDTDKWVTWQADDRFPSVYTIRINNTMMTVPAAAWCNSSISYSLDDLYPGIYDFQLRVYDCGGNLGLQDNVWITVLDTQPPVFTSATANYTIEYGERVWVNITATDDTPGIKRAWSDDSELLAWNDPWTSPLILNWDSVFPNKGVHNYTIMLTDKAGNFATHTCIVTIEDTTAPTAPDFPSDFSAESGQNAWVNFTLYDSYHDNYQIWLDDVMDVSTSYADGEYISYMLNFASPGEHNVTLVAWDEDVNTMRATCIVTYVDTTGPSIIGPDDFSFEAGESPVTSWSWTELDPNNYTIFENGTLDTFSTTFSGDIQHSLDGLTPGLWNITLIVYDGSGNFDTDTLWVTVEDTTAPDITGVIDQEISESESVLLNWTCSDLYPASLILTRNGSELINIVWDGNNYSYLVDGLDPGVYFFVLEVIDTSGNSEIDSVQVTITEETTSETTTTTTTTTTDTSTTDTTTPPPDDGGAMLMMVVIGAGGVLVVIIVVVFLKKKN